MSEVYYVQFKKAGKKYYFLKNSLEFNVLDYCVVETSKGIEVGQIASEVILLNPKEFNTSTLLPILRHATSQDLDNYLENKNLSNIAFPITKNFIKNRNLDMKLLDINYTLDKKKMIFYYTSEERIDFRDLLKDLAQEFKTRIELKQVGYRDGAKLTGGVGICGKDICCSTHLRDFDSVSIKMAKNQELSLNPTKITGVCSKLLCCIKYEDDLYTELKNSLVKVGDYVDTPNETNVKVVSLQVLKSNVVINHQGVNITYHATEIKKHDPKIVDNKLNTQSKKVESSEKNTPKKEVTSKQVNSNSNTDKNDLNKEKKQNIKKRTNHKPKNNVNKQEQSTNERRNT